ncbi:sulfite exporter TauE/SafE family protein [Provencibacterium massiliense]|uniref:sulfite exporter TauE/SafE family protein n=1 Tax=Provencibacterium massiliense TaxID=1841868 RepID=UPI0009A889C6|nr:sulfite exporter TauE/SafE family protein [Provencibacterium massiliense]RGB67577.1 sulfite exporter TauE/SafE family protein [Harryflintia acetispora]
MAKPTRNIQRGMMIHMEWLTALLPAFFGAVLSALGMGGGGVLLIYLTVFKDVDQFAAQGINLVFFIPIAIVSLIIHIKNKLVDFKVAAILIPAGILGVFAGSKLAGSLPDGLLRRLFAGFLLLIAFKEIYSAFKKPASEEETNAGQSPAKK